MKAKKKIILIFLCFIISFSIAQEIVIEGVYNGQNLYVKNPSTLGVYCVKEVFVNNILSKDEINSNAFEIDFSLLNIKNGELVSVKIIHSGDCTPEIVNPSAIKGGSSFIFLSVEINRKGFLLWKVKGANGGDVFEIEQYRWKKWLKSAELNISEFQKAGDYSYEITPTSGMNIFRIKAKDTEGNPIFSKEVKYRSSKREVRLVANKVKDKLEFTDKTIYEITDREGASISDGEGISADVSSLSKGEYWIYYDNKAEIFYKK